MSRKSQWILVAVVAAGALAVFAWMVWPQPVSRQEAIQAIRDFEGDSLLDPGRGSLLTTRWGAKTGPYRGFWVFARPDSSTGSTTTWYVNCFTGEVTSARHPGRIGPKHTGNVAAPRTQRECQSIAEAFARAKYRGFDEMGFRPHGEPTHNNSVWGFSWGPRYPGESHNRVRVSVNALDGSIVDYEASRDLQPGE